MSSSKKLFIALALLIVAGLAAVFVFTPRPGPETPLPNPNGYDDFVKAAPLVAADSSDWNTLSIEKLRQVVATNLPALDMIRAGLTKECRVVPYSLGATTVATNNHLSDLADTKRAAHAFCAASRLALLEGQTNQAALLALDCIRFGHESTRGGVLIDGLVGLAVQAIGLARLEESLAGTDAITARKLAEGLEDAAVGSESAETIFQREAQWARRGRFGRVNLVTQLLQPFLNRGMKAKANQRFAKGAVELQRAALHAAAHAYELDHGQPPAAARDLVPQYLKSIPLDPATGRELPLN
jgi:hypothetical protein